MGLSDEERLSGVYFAIRALNEQVHNWESDRYCQDNWGMEGHVCDEIKKLIKGMWHQLLGSQSNGAHWIMGSSSSNTIGRTSGTPWEVAVTEHLEKMVNREDKSVVDIDKDQPFDARKMCSIGYLLTHYHYHGRDMQYVFDIYQWLEQMIYYLRRYDDQFAKNLSGLSETISRISGLCFDVFSRYDEFAKAYLVHEIIEMLYGPLYPYREEKWDVVTKIMSKHNLHHDLTDLMSSEWKLVDIAKVHVTLVNAKTLAERKANKSRKTRYSWGQDRDFMKARLMALLTLNCKIGEYEHVFKDIEKALKEAGVLSNDVRKAMKNCVVRYAARKDRSDKRYDRESESYRLAAYGFASYRVAEVLGVSSIKEED